MALEERSTLGWRFLETMLTIRRFEETLVGLFNEKRFPGHYHLYIGQEATGVGATAALGAGDKLATTHRNHGHVLARGIDPGAAFAEILGKETGINKGRGGTIHLCDPALGFLQTSGIVGSVIGLAAGAGYACKLAGEGAIAVAFFGDGALEEGIAFEAMNMASLWKLPVLFICENNSAEAIGVAKGGYPTLIHASNDLRSIPGSLGIPALRVDGTDAFDVFDAVTSAVKTCREGNGPIFIEAMTKRWAGSAPLWPVLATGTTDIGMATGEVALPEGRFHEWFAKNDPVLKMTRRLVASSPDAERTARDLDAAVSERIAAARDFALSSPFPSAADAARYVFA